MGGEQAQDSLVPRFPRVCPATWEAKQWAVKPSTFQVGWTERKPFVNG